MEALSKCQPIFTKTWHTSFCTKFSTPNFVQIERYMWTLVHHLHEIGRNYIWELYLNLDRFSRNLADIILGSIQYVMPNFVQIERYIATLVHHLHEIGRNYVWELYRNQDRFSRNLADIFLGSIQYVMPNFVQIERYIATLVHHLHEIGRNYIWELYLNLDRFSRNLAHIILDLND